MENKKDYLSDGDQMKFRAHSSELIIQYYDCLKKANEWLDELGYKLPMSCRTNLRDAWFHYRKMYNQRVYNTVLQEQYALEEHLIRALKDAINYYYQEYLLLLECVYSQKDNIAQKNVQAEALFKEWKLSEDIKHISGEWLINLREAAEKNGMLLDYPALARYFYWTRIYSFDTKRILQFNIHKIKNFCMDLRMNGTKIYRPIDDQEYTDQCILVYNDLMNDIDSCKLKNLIVHSERVFGCSPDSQA